MNDVVRLITVIVPAYNAEKTISRCLESLLTQTIDRSNYEILVIDDGSTDDTAKLVGRFRGVALIKQQNQGPAAARNKGAECARGNIILFTDADCAPTANWIEQMLLPFEADHQVVGVKGAYRTSQKAIAARFVQYEYENKYKRMCKFKYIDFIDTYSAAFRRRVFMQFTGYDMRFPVACAEDVELSYRMASKGCKLVFNPHAVVYHMHPSTFVAYFKRKYKYSFWRILAVRSHSSKCIQDSHTPQSMKFQVVLIPLFLVCSMLSLLATEFVFACFVIFLLFLCSTIPFCLEVFRKDPIVGLISPGILMGRSLIQFLGILNGILRFWFFSCIK